MGLIYHITTREAWTKASETGSYVTPSLKEEGFIHCSELSQVEDIKSRFYEGVQDLVLLTIDTEKLTSQLIFEWSPSVQSTFPHIYGPINSDAVVELTAV
jgi:uncharacterized protein (DUF952 family)